MRWRKTKSSEFSVDHLESATADQELFAEMLQIGFEVGSTA